MLRQGSLLALLFSLHFSGVAQTSPPSPVSPASSASTTASVPEKAPLLAPAPYQDRTIEGLAPDEADQREQGKFDASGLPRGYSLEALADWRQSQGLTTRSVGLKASGYMDTLHFGSLSGNLTWQGDAEGSGTPTSYILRQVGMPFEGGWRADSALGMTNLPTLDLARKSTRITLTGPAMRGLTSHWLQNGDQGVLVGLGQPGRFEGFPVPNFTVTQGSYGLVGLHDQRRQADGLWQWGGMLAQARNVPSVLAVSPQGVGNLDAQGVYLTLRHEGGPGGRFWQANALAGSNTGADFAGVANPPANGLWLDGGFALGAHQNSWGLFRLDPGLAWLDLPLASDLQGGYWRHARRTRQWSSESGLDLLGSVSGTTPSGFFATSSLNYQYSTDTSFGGAISLRRFGAEAQSLLLYTQFANTLGSSRAQIEWGSADSGDRLTRLQFDHDWRFLQALRLSTSVSVDSDLKQGVASQGRGVAVNADWELGQTLTATNSIQGRWATDQTQYSVNAGFTWRFAPQWSLQTTLFAVQGANNLQAFVQSPLTPVPLPATAINDSGVFLSLRYDVYAGRASAPLGGSPGSAAGRLTGSVYLDENQNGKRDASDRGAVNVTVLLDGRYAAQTDAQGRFEFPYVRAGAHVITVSSDNLPLPWTIDKDGRTEVRVFTRDTTTVDIAAQRQ